MEKLDHRNSDKITWSEFLKFLDHEGMKREMVNDAQLYGMGVKRIQEKQRISLKETPNQIEYYIDCCKYISFGNNFHFLLALFENNCAKVFDTKTFGVVQVLTYPSNYGKPKQVKSQSQVANTKTAAATVPDNVQASSKSASNHGQAGVANLNRSLSSLHLLKKGQSTVKSKLPQTQPGPVTNNVTSMSSNFEESSFSTDTERANMQFIGQKQSKKQINNQERKKIQIKSGLLAGNGQHVALVGE